jgi:tryptophanyl-tRNA synthetase
MTIYHHVTGATMKQIESEFEGKGYGDFKKALAEAVVAHLEPVTKRMQEFQSDPHELMRILDTGRETAQGLAAEKMKLVRSRVGLGR